MKGNGDKQFCNKDSQHLLIVLRNLFIKASNSFHGFFKRDQTSYFNNGFEILTQSISIFMN